MLAREPAWLAEMRQAAMARFQVAGYPTSRSEEWRFTPLSAITQVNYEPASEPMPWPGISDIEHLLYGDTDFRLVFVNGHYAPALSHLPIEQGLEVYPLPQLPAQNPRLLQELLGVSTLHQDAFSDLNFALHEGGAAIVVAPDTGVARPIHLIYLAAPALGPWMSHSRNLIHLGGGSQARIIEHYAALPETGIYWNNAHTQIVLDADARAEHYMLVDEGSQGRNISTLVARLDTRSHLASHTALTGGLLVRNNIHVELRGQHADALVNGLFIGTDKQTLDNHMRVIHGCPNCDSRQFYKGILADESHGIFTGRIVVEPDAQKTDAKQTSRNLLLSDKARIHADPQLEIYADDVKCTHGATTGQIDPEALFYLQSRGIDEAQARQMLIQAFALESLDRMSLIPVRTRLQEQLARILTTIQSSMESTS
jgi:Fe-S cluster assembly protein SufD